MNDTYQHEKIRNFCLKIRAAHALKATGLADNLTPTPQRLDALAGNLAATPGKLFHDLQRAERFGLVSKWKSSHKGAGLAPMLYAETPELRKVLGSKWVEAQPILAMLERRSAWVVLRECENGIDAARIPEKTGLPVRTVKRKLAGLYPVIHGWFWDGLQPVSLEDFVIDLENSAASNIFAQDKD